MRGWNSPEPHRSLPPGRLASLSAACTGSSWASPHCKVRELRGSGAGAVGTESSRVLNGTGDSARVAGGFSHGDQPRMHETEGWLEEAARTLRGFGDQMHQSKSGYIYL